MSIPYEHFDEEDPPRERSESREPRGSREQRGHDECYACPVGSLFASFDAASPDMMEHLLAAAHELLQVARTAIDAADAAVERQREARPGASGAPRVHRIDLD